MNHTPSPRAPRGVSRFALGGLAVALAATIGTLGFPAVSSSSTTFSEVLRGDRHGALGEADGVVRGNASVFDDKAPAVAKLDPSLLEALRRAAVEAAEDGVELRVNSGWRSAAYQEQLLREAISTYGSRHVAARWVATPSMSPHVSGDAVDIGGHDAAAWLAEHGAARGLCQIYGNEPWHFELRPEAVDGGCPPEYADPTHDPRMQEGPS